MFGLPADLPILVDAAVMQRARIVLGGGSRSWKVLAAPEILLALRNVEVVEGLAAPAPPRAPPTDDAGSGVSAGSEVEPGHPAVEQA